VLKWRCIVFARLMMQQIVRVLRVISNVLLDFQKPRICP